MNIQEKIVELRAAACELRRRALYFRAQNDKDNENLYSVRANVCFDYALELERKIKADEGRKNKKASKHGPELPVRHGADHKRIDGKSIASRQEVLRLFDCS
jgi:hypothetical protein